SKHDALKAIELFGGQDFFNVGALSLHDFVSGLAELLFFLLALFIAQSRQPLVANLIEELLAVFGRNLCELLALLSGEFEFRFDLVGLQQ
ncbi:MAG TPA: hypothetical protein VFO40_01490, partial [Chthoniobacterales bacterium]|nr:hypothetical protein [Chthoniobacterales bacterium]